ncbi:MAG: hypothetical protein MJ072_03650, partial [Clostridia bacterium]|nr:hypothetical protein [Clostridia bacterium]
SHSNSVVMIFDKLRERGIEINSNTMTHYAAFAEKNGTVQEVSMLDALRGDIKDAVIRERTPEEEANIRAVSTPDEQKKASQHRETAKINTLKREMAPFFNNLEEYKGNVSNNKMFFSFMQSSQYSKFEKAFSNFNKHLQKGASAKDIKASLVELKIRTKKYLDFKGNPPEKDKLGRARVECLKRIFKDLEDAGVKDLQTTIEASDPQTSAAMNNFEDMKKAEKLGKDLDSAIINREGKMQEVHQLANELGMVDQDINIDMHAENREEVGTLKNDVIDDEEEPEKEINNDNVLVVKGDHVEP